MSISAINLPIHDKKDELIRALRASQVAIVTGETGSGKTTQLPLFCLEAGLGKHGKIGVTQPRRIAATSVASYVASQLSCPLGSLVGYKVRFSDRESSETKIKFMTDGILLRELSADRHLNQYDVIIIDEVHERSLNIDYLIGYFKWLLPQRPDLRLVLSSATIDTDLFSKAFSRAPVITVSGRLFPIDILHHTPASSADEEISFVNLAADTAQQLLESSDSGDILVFMPTERDILETCDLLEGRLKAACRVLPMYGRMPLGEQAAIFYASDKRKIVVATNIAETSVTVPNVRFVVDTGLARVKRFDPAMGFTRLPVEPVSQASARQRAGRCGRVQNGMCVRLYSEEDLLSRPEYTPPEIQRANLGQVILSMATLELGAIEDFPFLQSPSRQSISQGYRTLEELGALDESRRLTDLGRRMAAFPVDPALSRMLLQARQERCMREILIIASALCVQDTKVRPADKKGLADAAHARFSDPLSDFIFYLKLWDASGWDSAPTYSLTTLRKFCKAHYLSFVRMREWRDVYNQLFAIVEKNGEAAKGQPPAGYDQIHRCIAAGFISHVAKKNDDGTFQVAKGRVSSMFPGSALFKKRPDWIVSSELVETSRLYSRTCASIDPLWLESIAPHLCKRRYSEPFFDEETGGVKAKEAVSLFGLALVTGRIVGYGRINVAEAADVFVREALCAGRLKAHYKFFKHNIELCSRVESFEKKLRTSGIHAGEETIFAFYKSRLPGVTSVHELNAYLQRPGGAESLFMKESDVLLEQHGPVAGLFPDSVCIGCVDYPIAYEFDPSSELDGASVRLPSSEMAFINHTVFDWIVPGLFEPRIRFLLESLPRSTKRHIEDVSETARSIASSLSYAGKDFLDSAIESAGVLFGISIDPHLFQVLDLPPHLMVKVVVEKKHHSSRQSSNAAAWQEGCGQWIKKNLRSWNFGDLPPRFEVIQNKNGFPVFGYPALAAHEDTVDCTVFASQEDQEKNHIAGAKRLAELILEKEFAWLERDLKVDAKRYTALMPVETVETFRGVAFSLMKKHCFANTNFLVWKKSEFQAIIDTAQSRLASLGPKIGGLVGSIISAFVELQSILKTKSRSCNSKGYANVGLNLKQELTRYIQILLTKSLNFEMFMQYPRYLEAFRVKLHRAFSDPGRYLSRCENTSFYVRKSEALLSHLTKYHPKNQEFILNYAMMVEEFKISIFAQQEVKTLFPISEKRLDEKLENLRISGVPLE